MISFLKTDSSNLDFQNLVKELDIYLAEKDGDDHYFYVQFNKIDALKNCIVLYENEFPIGCGAIKPLNEESMEIKRMFVKPEFRGKGYASKILIELENWAKDLGYLSTILETGKKQTEAIQLYSKTYEIIPNYDQYIGIVNSVCFKKNI